MRVPTDMPRPQRRPISRAGLVVTAFVLLVIVTSLRTIAVFYTDYLWFEEVGFTNVWRTTLFTKIGLSVAFTAVFFVLMYVNLAIAERLAPKFRPYGPEDEIVERYREIIGPHAGKLRIAVALLFALIAGVGASSQYQDWILFRNSADFGVNDPQFGRDIGFFVFQLPFLTYVAQWAFVALVIVLIVTAAAHYLNGGIRVNAPLERVTAQVKAHLSVLLGVIALVRAVGYYLQRFELNFSDRGVVAGAGYTDVNARLPATNLLIGISVFSALLFLFNIRQRGWRLPGIAIGLWALVSVVVASIYPAIIQSVRVGPNELELEREFIGRNIEATRAAMNIGAVEEEAFPYDEDLTGAELSANAASIRNVRLWDPNVLGATYAKLQEIRQYYQFADVDIDRYTIDDAQTQVVLSVRGLKPSDIPGESWTREHLQYTHGYGAVLSAANAVNEDGLPQFIVRDLPPRGDIEIEEPRVYFGEALPGYAIANTKQAEIDYQTPDGEDVTSNYASKSGGVRLSSSLRRFAFFLRFNDVNLMISEQVTPRSRVIFNRDISARVRAAAPFLKFDSDPYAVVSGGRILWMYDAYTTTSRYPYAQPANVEGLRSGSGLQSSFNYVRNSVKVVIDAYDGTMTFYLWDQDDPIARAYDKAFPGLFTPGTQMPDELREHVRYPEDLFRVQANAYGRYHVTRADSFYQGNDAWDVAQDPGTGRVSNTIETTPTTGGNTAITGGAPARTQSERIEPTYLLLRLPNSEAPSFVILQPFVPSSRNDEQINLTAFLVGDSDGENYGRLESYVLPRGEQIDGPLVVNSAIQAEPDISEELRAFERSGSRAIFGQVQMIPLENSLLYVRPLYITAEQTQLFEMRRVIVVFGGRAVMKPTLREALIELFGSAPDTLEEEKDETPPDPGDDDTPPVATDGDIAELLEQADTAFAKAEEALRNGDLAEFERLVEEGREFVRRARERANSATTTTTTLPPQGA